MRHEEINAFLATYGCILPPELAPKGKPLNERSQAISTHLGVTWVMRRTKGVNGSTKDNRLHAENGGVK